MIIIDVIIVAVLTIDLAMDSIIIGKAYHKVNFISHTINIG